MSSHRYERPQAPTTSALSVCRNDSTAEIPADEEAEKCVLGTLLTGSEAIEELKDGIDPCLFFAPASRIILAAILEMHAANAPIDIIVLGQRLRDAGQLENAGGAAHVTQLATTYNKTIDIAQYEISRLRELYALRQLRELSTKLGKTSSSSDATELITEADSLLHPLKAYASGSTNSAVSWDCAIGRAVVSSTEITKLHLKPRAPLLADWLCAGDLGMVYAYRGVGKTWLALLIAKALSEGSQIGPWTAHRKTKVLYVDGEMPIELMRNRDQGLTRGEGEIDFLNHEVLFDRTQKVINITSLNVQSAITGYCLKKGVEVVILDNLSTLASGMKENDASDWEQVNNWLLQFRRHRIAVILVHHAGRNGEARGTSKREDATFWVITLDDAKKQGDNKCGARFISRFTKPSRNTQEEVPAYEWNVVTDMETGEITTTYKPAQSLDVFRRCIEEGVTDCSQIAGDMKVSPSTVSRMAQKGINEGWLRKKGREYELKDERDER